MGRRDARTDVELVAAANEGDVSGFEGLYHRYRDWVAGLAYRYTGDRELALDVVQETFLYLLKKFPGFRLTAGMKTFLYPAVKHLSISLQRKRRRMVSGEGAPEQVAAKAAPPDGGRAALAEAVEGLPEGQREVLLMRFVDGMKLAEIAAALEIPLGTVKSRMHHALRALRDREIRGR